MCSIFNKNFPIGLTLAKFKAAVCLKKFVGSTNRTQDIQVTSRPCQPLYHYDPFLPIDICICLLAADGPLTLDVLSRFRIYGWGSGSNHQPFRSSVFTGLIPLTFASRLRSWEPFCHHLMRHTSKMPFTSPLNPLISSPRPKESTR